MKGRKQKISSVEDGYPKGTRTESERVWGAQTFMWISENSLVTVQPSVRELLELIVSPKNVDKACKQVKRNSGACGVDQMGVEALLPYLQVHVESLTSSIMGGSYRPNPVRRVEIPKDNGKTRQLGIPTVVDRAVQQAISVQ